jgi:hypothetical protein
MLKSKVAKLHHFLETKDHIFVAKSPKFLVEMLGKVG